ncbi:efflux RND transporter periplasmic adaptor subunit [Pseudodesulfovibrio tunisiensis]|uniref:efflux RND transporter periplasmic adaptor subunit n=1 Tax=Pseudodesulfovibrio tunisiensis TaxID=463192 RepID=UPI001FB27E93|nr:efflux RND transporter periplasmic adaptor subunit [Pseudodesulfovibrio tunisiensis]
MNRKALFFCLVVALLLAGCKEEVKKADPIRPVRVFTVSGQSGPEQRTFPGKVRATREVALAFRVAGQIEKFDVREGDFVKKGQILAMLDQRDYQAAVADLEAKLQGLRSVLNEAKLNYERNKALLESDTIAQAAFDAAQSTFETSRANVRSLEQELRRARLNLQYTSLEAPYSGTIAVKYVDNHEYVQAKEAIVQLEDIASLDIEIDVPEAVWIRAFSGEGTGFVNAEARFESYPGQAFPLKIKEFQTKANPETQTYQVTLSMANPETLSIHPGMTAQVSGDLPGADGAHLVSIPVSSVQGEPGDGMYVWVLGADNTVTRRKVNVGRIVRDEFLVDQGVKPGDTIVSCGVSYLSEGQKVKVLKGRIGGRG